MEGQQQRAHLVYRRHKNGFYIGRHSTLQKMSGRACRAFWRVNNDFPSEHHRNILPRKGVILWVLVVDGKNGAQTDAEKHYTTAYNIDSKTRKERGNHTTTANNATRTL